MVLRAKCPWLVIKVNQARKIPGVDGTSVHDFALTTRVVSITAPKYWLIGLTITNVIGKIKLILFFNTYQLCDFGH